MFFRAILILLTAAFAKVSFKGHQVFQVTVTSDAQADLFLLLQHKSDVDLWNTAKKGPVTFSIAPKKINKVKSLLKQHNLLPEVLFGDLQNLIDEQQRESEVQPLFSQTGSRQKVLGNIQNASNFFQRFQTIDSIQEWFNDLAAAHSDIVKPFSIGKTYEGRTISGVIIHGSNSTEENPKEIFFHGGIHAREWIGPATGISKI
jgi:hypothetical protein